MMMTRRQRTRIAIRRMFLMAKSGTLTPDADALLGYIRRYSGAGQSPARFSKITATTDPMATGIAIGMAMVYDEICNLLYLDEPTRRTTGNMEDE